MHARLVMLYIGTYIVMCVILVLSCIIVPSFLSKLLASFLMPTLVKSALLENICLVSLPLFEDYAWLEYSDLFVWRFKLDLGFRFICLKIKALLEYSDLCFVNAGKARGRWNLHFLQIISCLEDLLVLFVNLNYCKGFTANTSHDRNDFTCFINIAVPCSARVAYLDQRIWPNELPTQYHWVRIF